jgi:hypothetical protein
MKALTAIFVTVGLLYYLDSAYSDGRYLDILTQMAKHLSAGLGFYW